MIQPNELRVGNVLMYTGSDEGLMRCKIDAIDIMQCDGDNTMFNEIHSPIPLTPELLIELGAEETEPEYLKEFYFHGKLIIFGVNGAYDYATRARLPYLHTLQNFIFALRGVEIEINTSNQ